MKIDCKGKENGRLLYREAVLLAAIAHVTSAAAIGGMDGRSGTDTDDSGTAIKVQNLTVVIL